MKCLGERRALKRHPVEACLLIFLSSDQSFTSHLKSLFAPVRSVVPDKQFEGPQVRRAEARRGIVDLFVFEFFRAVSREGLSEKH